MTRDRLLRPLVAAALLPLSLLAPAAAGAATGDASDGGLWYYTATGMEQLHQRSTGAGITIAIVDTTVNPEAPDLVGTDVQVREPAFCAAPDGSSRPAATDDPGSRHASHIAALISGTGAGVGGEPGTRGIAPGAAVEVFALAPDDQLAACTPVESSAAFQAAVTSGADIVNVSADLDLGPEDMLAALRAGVIVVGSGGNHDVVDSLPATFNGAIATGTLAPGLTLAEGSPRGPVLGVVAPGAEIRAIAPDWQRYGKATGSSDAAAFTSAALALTWSLYPDATANQIMQSLIRNTGGTEHEPGFIDESWGYGLVNVRQMLDSDPRSYPDVNPFLRDDAAAVPSMEAAREALGMAEPAASASPTPEAAEDVGGTAGDARPDDEAEESSSTLMVVGIVAAVTAAAAVVILVLVRRRRGTTPTSTDSTSTAGGHHG